MEEPMQRARAEPQPHRTLTPVIVFDAEPSSRARLSEALRRTGLSVLEATTPLEAVYALSRASKVACLAFVGGCLAATTPREFIGFALEEFPRLLLVTAGFELPEDDERVHRLCVQGLEDGAGGPALSALLGRLLPEMAVPTTLAS